MTKDTTHYKQTIKRLRLFVATWTLFSALLVISAPHSIAQVTDERTLVTIGNEAVSVSEFLRMYDKDLGNNVDEVGIDDFLQQYILFKQKVADALSERLDTSSSFRSELNGYRDLLAQNYLTSHAVKDELLQEAYKRYMLEINAWHILIQCPSDASPSDTLVAWNRAITIRNRLINGEPFEHVAKGSSDDPSVITNGGNLGYFTVFQMIAPFEEAAYALKKGEISQPVRTSLGFHIIKVVDRRPSSGTLLVSHIMKDLPPGASEQKAEQAKRAIDSIYQELQSGSSFASLAERCSDHKETAVRGGMLDWFGVGEIITEFSEAAIALKDTGSYTKPIRTPYGWHIIKLHQKIPPRSFDEMKPILESNLKQSFIMAKSREAMVENLKKEYNFTLNMDAVNWFITNSDSSTVRGLVPYDLSIIPTETLFSFNGHAVSCNEYALFVNDRGPLVATDDPQTFFNSMSNELISNYILQYENSILEDKYPEFKYTVQEFHDGLLLFLISEKRVWNIDENDSTALYNFYSTISSDYTVEESIDTKVYSYQTTEKKGAKILSSTYRKLAKSVDRDSIMMSSLNKGRSKLTITNRRWYKGEDSSIDRANWERGKTIFTTIDGKHAIVVITEVHESYTPPLPTVADDVIARFQDQREKEWREQLKVKYHVNIDTALFDEIRKRADR